MLAASEKAKGAEEAKLGTSRAQIQSATKHSSINQTAAFPNPAGPQRSPAGKQKLTLNGDNLSLECCHICKISLAMPLLLRGVILPTSEPDETQALSGSQVALTIAPAVLLPLGKALEMQRERRRNLSLTSRRCCN